MTDEIRELETRLMQAVDAFNTADDVALAIDHKVDGKAFDKAWQVRTDALAQVGILASVWTKQKRAIAKRGKKA
jgi:hypothetical protein